MLSIFFALVEQVRRRLWLLSTLRRSALLSLLGDDGELVRLERGLFDDRVALGGVGLVGMLLLRLLTELVLVDLNFLAQGLVKRLVARLELLVVNF